MAAGAVYEWQVVVRQWNAYGDRVVLKTPTTIQAASWPQVTDKVRDAFGATFDEFRKVWSHDWTLVDMREVSQARGAKPERTTHLMKVWRERALAAEAEIRAAKADAWDERGKAEPQYLGPDDGHYADDCAGWEDCHCASYPNPYRERAGQGEA